MQSLEGFKRRNSAGGKDGFLRKFQMPFLLVSSPGVRGGRALWVHPVRNRSEEGLFKEEISIGRAEENDIVLDLESVSKSHAQITETDGEWQIIDLNSKNGTTLNGLPLAPFAAASIRSGQIIGFGKEVKAVFMGPSDFWNNAIRGTGDPFEIHGTEQD